MEIKSRERDRHIVAMPTSCQVAGEKDRSWPGQIRDVSLRGAGLLLETRIEPGTVLDFEIPENAIDMPKTLAVRVVHATALPGGQWLHGCVLVKPLSEDELQRLLGQGKPAAEVAPVVQPAPAPVKPQANVQNPHNVLNAFAVDQVFASWFNQAQGNGRATVPQR